MRLFIGIVGIVLHGATPEEAIDAAIERLKAVAWPK